MRVALFPDVDDLIWNAVEENPTLSCINPVLIFEELAAFYSANREKDRILGEHHGLQLSFPKLNDF